MYPSLGFPDLVPPPREVPFGLRLKVLDHRDIGWAAAFFAIATLLLYASLGAPPKARTALVVAASIFVLLGVATALNILLKAAESLRFMRAGILVPARIVACRWAWDRKGRERPYASFLADWQADFAKSQMRKAWGCFGIFAFIVVGLPFLAFALFTAIALGLNLMGYGERVSAAELRTGMLLVGSSVLMVGLGYALFRFIGGTGIDKGLIPVLKAEQAMEAIEGRDYEALVERLKALVEGDTFGGESLPADSNGIQLDCRVQFILGGELRTAEGRVHLDDRLQRDGIEPVLFDPRKPRRLGMLAGLPRGVEIDPAKRSWAEVAPGAAVFRLGAALLFGTVSLAGCFWSFVR